jgi:hypothetical protein
MRGCSCPTCSLEQCDRTVEGQAMTKPHEDPNCKCAACEAHANEERLVAASNLVAREGQALEGIELYVEPSQMPTITAWLLQTGVTRIERLGPGNYVMHFDDGEARQMKRF